MNDPLPPPCQQLILKYAVNDATYGKLQCVCKEWHKWAGANMRNRVLAAVCDLCKNKSTAKQFVELYANAPLKTILEYRNHKLEQFLEPGRQINRRVSEMCGL